MRIRLLSVGRLKNGPERLLCDTYLARARASGPQAGFSHFDVVELSESKAATAEARKADEAERLTARLTPGAYLIVLDERGKDLKSRELAALLQGEAATGRQNLDIIIGGPDGLAETVRAGADLALCLGRLTWPHQMVRIMLSEQLYRIVTIAQGHPYHRD